MKKAARLSGFSLHIPIHAPDGDLPRGNALPAVVRQLHHQVELIVDLQGEGLPPGGGSNELDLMAQTMAILNPAYFSGYAAQLREEVKASDHYAMWRKHSGFAPIGYINSMLEEQDQDPRQVVVELN